MANKPNHQNLTLFASVSLLFFLSFFIYSNSLDVPFIFDDIPKVVQNQDIQSFERLKEKLIFSYKNHARKPNENDPSRPVVSLSFALNYSMGGLKVFGYHCFNILVHAFCAILVFFLLLMIFRACFQIDRVYPALFASLFFVSHPINANAAAYLFSRSDLLATLFILCALLSYGISIQKKKIFYCLLSIFSFILALFSKQNAVVFPVLLFLLDFFILSNFSWPLFKNRLKYHVSFWLVLAAYLSFRIYYLGGIGDLEAYRTFPRTLYLMNQPYVISRYLSMIFIPSGFSIDHSLEPMVSVFEWKVFLPVFIGVFSLGGLFYAVLKKRTPLLRFALFSVLWFLVCVIPTSSFFPTTSLMVENRVYLAGIGIYSLTGILLWFIIENRILFLTACSVLVALLSILTVARNEVYRDPVRLWQETLDLYPHNYRAYVQMGMHYSSQANTIQAIRSYQNAIELNPNFVESYYNLGNVYLETKDYEKAVQCYKKTIDLDSGFSRAYHNMGIALILRGKPDEAARYFKMSKELEQ